MRHTYSYEAAAGYLTAALHQAESMQASPSQWATTHLNLGQAYRKLKDYPNAIASLKRTLELNPQNVTAHSALGSCYMMLNQTEEAILAYHEALAIHPGEPITTQLLKIVLQDALDLQTRSKLSSKHSMKFPLLSDVVAEDLDWRVRNDETRFFGKMLRIDEGEVEDAAVGTAPPPWAKNMKLGNAARHQTPSAVRAGGTKRTRQSSAASAAHQPQGNDTMDIESSQDMSLQQSSPNNATVPLPTSTASSSTYGYGGASRRTTRSSAAAQPSPAWGTRQRVDSEFESQGENAEYEEGTERSYAGSDMVD